ncbi:hypothetical protein AOLI_G00309660 [Acnodon oligacanthus]
MVQELRRNMGSMFEDRDSLRRELAECKEIANRKLADLKEELKRQLAWLREEMHHRDTIIEFLKAQASLHHHTRTSQTAKVPTPKEHSPQQHHSYAAPATQDIGTQLNKAHFRSGTGIALLLACPADACKVLLLWMWWRENKAAGVSPGPSPRQPWHNNRVSLSMKTRRISRALLTGQHSAFSIVLTIKQ